MELGFAGEVLEEAEEFGVVVKAGEVAITGDPIQVTVTGFKGPLEHGQRLRFQA